MDTAGGLQKCLNFLKGNSDEQRLVGLLLATKYVQGEDKSSILQIFDAVGTRFLNRLLMSGLHGTTEQDEAYVPLALSVLSAFCRVPELAASNDMIEKIPTLLEILKNRQEDAVSTDCLECLLGIASASTEGRLCLKKAGAHFVLLRCFPNFKPGSDCVRSSLKLARLLMTRSSFGKDICDSTDIIISSIQALAEILSFEQEDLKLDILLLLQILCSPEILLQNDLPKEGRWVNAMRNVIGQVLRSQCAIDLKWGVLELTKSVVEYSGSAWLLGPMILPGDSKETPLDRFFLLLVETLRVETFVLLSEVATSRFHTEPSNASNPNKLVKGQQLLATCYFLLESVIDITIEEEDIERLSDVALKRTVSVLNDIVNTVVEFLQEAKRQNISKGDDILASARLFGRYLADAPLFQRDLSKKFLSMLEFLLSIKGDSEESPFFVFQFLLPAISELTREEDGCKAFVSWGGHKQVIAFLLTAIVDEKVPLGSLVKAGDALLNVLQKENAPREFYGVVDFLPLLSGLPSWAESTDQCMAISMAGSICALILRLTTEDVLVHCVSSMVLSNVYSLLLRVLGYLQMFEVSPEQNEEEDLWEITVSACMGIVDRYPSFKDHIKLYGVTSSTNLLLNNLLDKCKETN